MFASKSEFELKKKRRKEKYKVEIIKKILHLQIQDYS